MRVAVGLEAFLAPLTTNTRLLVAAKECLWCWLLPRVDEDGARLQTLSDPLRSLDVLSPDAGTKTRIGVVRPLDDLLLVRPWLGWHDGPEWLLGDDLGVVGRVVDNGWLDEEALARLDICIADRELVTPALAVFEEGLDFFVL